MKGEKFAGDGVWLFTFFGFMHGLLQPAAGPDPVTSRVQVLQAGYDRTVLERYQRIESRFRLCPKRHTG